MPTYDYQCGGCGSRWEAFLSVGDRELPCELPCPQCKKKKVQRAWITPPTGGVDATRGPGADFKELARKMGRGLPPKARENMERAASLRGRKYGPQ